MTRAAGCYFEPGKRCNKNSGDLMQHILLKSDYDLREPPLLHGNFWLQVVSRKVKNKFLNHLMIADTHQTPTEVFFLFLKPITGLCSLSFTWFNGLTGEQEMPETKTTVRADSLVRVVQRARKKLYYLFSSRAVSSELPHSHKWGCSLAMTRNTKEIIILSDAF